MDELSDSEFTPVIRAYNTMKVNQQDTHLIFWTLSSVKLMFPNLSKIVMKTIHVPASNVAIESLFSHTTEIKNFKRSKLTSANLCDILTLYYADLYMTNYNLTNYFKSSL